MEKEDVCHLAVSIEQRSENMTNGEMEGMSHDHWVAFRQNVCLSQSEYACKQTKILTELLHSNLKEENGGELHTWSSFNINAAALLNVLKVHYLRGSWT